MKRKTRTEHILTVMHILAWVAFIGFLIETGSILISYGVSVFNPEAAKDVYKGLDLYSLSQHNFWFYTQSISFMVALAAMKAYTSKLAIKTLSKFNLQEPFTAKVVFRLENISYVALGIWIVTWLSNANTRWLEVKTGVFSGDIISIDFIYMVGLMFVMAQVFKRGVEIQSENELTV